MSISIGVIGAGPVGTALARGLHRAGHRVTVGVRDPERPPGPLAGLGIRVALPPAAAGGARAVVLAVPAGALAEAVAALGDLTGRVVVDVTNAVGGPPPGGHPTVFDHVVDLAPGAFVVKAFNTIGAEHLEDGAIGGRPAFLPVAGADEGRSVVLGLARDLGFDAADLGGPDAVPLVEAAARMWIHLAVRRRWGRDFGFGVLRP